MTQSTGAASESHEHAQEFKEKIGNRARRRIYS